MATISKVGNISGRRLSNISPAFEFEGDWLSAKEFFKRLPETAKRAVQKGQLKFAKKYRQALIDNISNHGASLGGANWQPVSELYATYKSSHGQSPADLWHWHGYIQRNIRVHTSRGKWGVEVGIKKGIRNPMTTSDLEVGQYAAVLEMGSHIRNIEARPLFRPTYKAIGGNRFLKECILESLSASIKRKHLIA